MTHAQMLGRMSSLELTEWKAFYIRENERQRAQVEAAKARQGKK